MYSIWAAVAAEGVGATFNRLEHRIVNGGKYEFESVAPSICSIPGFGSSLSGWIEIINLLLDLASNEYPVLSGKL